MSITTANADLKPLFEPVTIGAFEAKNRIFMAPLTRSRSEAKTNEQTGLHTS